MPSDLKIKLVPLHGQPVDMTVYENTTIKMIKDAYSIINPKFPVDSFFFNGEQLQENQIISEIEHIKELFVVVCNYIAKEETDDEDGVNNDPSDFEETAGTLAELGFSLDLCKKALRQSNYETDSAMQLLFTGKINDESSHKLPRKFLDPQLFDTWCPFAHKDENYYYKLPLVTDLGVKYANNCNSFIWSQDKEEDLSYLYNRSCGMKVIYEKENVEEDDYEYDYSD